MTTGQLIRAARKNAGMTQAELAQKLGISYVGISQWENDLRNPKYETLQRIADALGVEPRELMSYDGSIRVHVTPEQREYSELSGKAAKESITPEELKRLEELQAKLPPLSESVGKLSATLDRLSQYMEQLNTVGQQKVEDYVQDLTRIREYRRQEPPQSALPNSGGTDTTPPADAPERPQEGEEGGR